MHISYWSSDVCSSDLKRLLRCSAGTSGKSRAWVSTAARRALGSGSHRMPHSATRGLGCLTTSSARAVAGGRSHASASSKAIPMNSIEQAEWDFARTVADRDAVLRVYASPEFDERSADGMEGLRALVV